MNKKEYTTGPTLFDSDEELYFTKVGESTGKRKLCFTVWGDTEIGSSNSATILVDLLTSQESKKAIPVKQEKAFIADDTKIDLKTPEGRAKSDNVRAQARK